MNQKNFMLKLVTVPLFALTALCFTACGDNPIEVENAKQVDLSLDIKSATDSLESRRKNMDYYTCYNTAKSVAYDYKKRCKNFIDKFSNSTDTVLSLETIIKMVKDVDRYNDKGNFIGTNDDPKINYLTESKMLSITLNSYTRKADSLKPEIRFLVKTYIDAEPSEYDPISATILDTVDLKEWTPPKTDEGKKVAIQIPRGIDAIEICPIIRDKNVHDDYYDDEDLLIQDDCISVKNLGWVKENPENPVIRTTRSQKATLIWEWFLYSIE
jgi:hypothetical protein